MVWVLLKLAAPSLSEIYREFYLSKGWKSGEGRWCLLVIVTLSAVLCCSPINSNSPYKWDPGGLMLGGTLLQPSDTSLPGPAGAHLCGLLCVGGEAFPCSALHWACLNWSELLKEHFLPWFLGTGSSASLGPFS